MRFIIIIVIALTFSTVIGNRVLYLLHKQDKDIKTEYQLELTDNNTLKLYSIHNDTLYTIPVDSLVHTLEVDNL